MRVRRSVGGFTLLELLIAVALMAVLAVLSWRGLDAVLTARAQITRSSDDLQTLVVAFTQMDEDLRRSWPVRQLKLNEPSIQFRVSAQALAPSMEVIRQSVSGLEPTRLQRVSWRLRAGRLERGFAPWQNTDDLAAEARARAQTAGAVTDSEQEGERAGWVWQPVLENVAQWSISGYLENQDWLPAETLAVSLRAGRAAPGAVPVTGVLVRIVQQDGRVLQRVFPVRD